MKAFLPWSALLLGLGALGACAPSGVGLAPQASHALDTLQTAAERSGYRETTRYAEVVSFLNVLAQASPGIHRTSFGTTVEGRDLPLVVWGAPQTSAEAVRATGKTRVLVFVSTVLSQAPPGLHPPFFGTTVEGRDLPLVVWGAPQTSAEAVRATGKTRVLVFANIHAGEVAGKEALLELLRELARGRHAAWADSLVLLAAPIYNADGNERIGHDHRPLQDGPEAGMGVRPNAQGLDLNRDFMKLDAPESRALVALLTAYDPHVVVDLHTTNGTHMGYVLTYAPPLGPDTPSVIATELFDRLLPHVTRRLRETDGYETYHYGNIPGAFGEPARAPRGWYSFDWRPRFGTNYAGLRGRFGVLSEAYSYAPYRVRIGATRRFVEEILAYAHAHAAPIRRMTAEADRAGVAGDSLALSARLAALPEPVDILLAPVDTLRHAVTGAPVLRMRVGETRRERMPAFVRFEASLRERAPRAYYVPASLPDVLALLRAHGAPVGRAEAVPAGPVEAFRVAAVREAAQPFQGRRTLTVEGAWGREEAPPGGYHRVPTDGPLGRLVFALLEPRHEDGVAAWGLLPAGALAAGASYPILRQP